MLKKSHWFSVWVIHCYIIIIEDDTHQKERCYSCAKIAIFLKPKKKKKKRKKKKCILLLVEVNGQQIFVFA